MTKDQLPELTSTLPMPSVKSPKGVSKIEQTRRALYDALAKIRKAKKHPKATDALETALEEHLEEISKDGEHWQKIAIDRHEQLSAMRQERDECQERMRIIDEAYAKSQQALVIAGDELRECQTNVRHWREEAGKLDSLLNVFRSGDVHQKYLRDRQDLMAAEKLSDELSEKLSAATTVIGQLEQLVAGQRKAIADMHNELTHRRVIGKAFMQARMAFVALDEALHEAPQSKAVRAVGDDIVCAGQPAGEGV